MSGHDSRAIAAGERTGVLRPANLERFSARWIAPAAGIRHIVDTYWTVSWDLSDGEPITQRIIDFPAITLSIEDGDVDAPFVISAVRPGAWVRTIRGRGTVFAMRLRPAGLACLGAIDPASLGPEQALTPELDRDIHHLLARVADAPTADARAVVADEAIQAMARQRVPSRGHALANGAIDALVASPVVRPIGVVAAEIGTSRRTLQRVLRATLGLGPHDVARRIRLQEVVRRLSAPGAHISTVASELGYVDQAHLANEFRTVTGVTPGRYLRGVDDA